MHQSRRLIAPIALLIALCATAAAKDDFLLPEQAFRISAEVAGPDSVRIGWDIEPGYYLYRSKLKFDTATPAIELGDPESPEGEIRNDEFFGEVEVYRNRVEVAIPLERGPEFQGPLSLEATSQGCADEGFCYPPLKQRVSLALPRVAAADSPASPPPGGESPAKAEVEQPTSQSPGLDQKQESASGIPSNLGRPLFPDEEKILEPEEAYKFTADVTAPDQLLLDWLIADGTYLYADEIQVALEDGPDVSLGPYQLPEPEIKSETVRPDGTIGDIAVYHGRIELPVPLLRGSKDPTTVGLVVRYQGCAEAGICYPPITKRLSLELPAATSISAAAAAQAAPEEADSTPAQAAGSPEQPVSESDRIAGILAGGNLWAVAAIFFGSGLLLAFTPCVFPMIPILSGIIAGQGSSISTRKAFVLSLVYVLAMALTYTVAGVLAGLFGANLQAAFQNPWILGLFALVFVALAMSMFGFYELQLPSSLQSKLANISNRQEGGTLAGVAVMGLLSALIVGPCVAPPLAGALIFIGQTGDAVLGGMALFALSMDMGAPLIAIGTSAGRLLPKAGAWMDTVKAVFGVGMLAVAIILLERILPPAAAMVLWGLLLVCSGVYMGALQHLPPDAGGWRKLWKGVGFVLLTYGVLMLIGAAAGGKDTVQPLRGLGLSAGGEAAQHATFKRIKTTADLDREVAAAGQAGKPVLLDFYADWCVACKEMERYTFSDPAVLAAMKRFVLLQADVTANDEQDQALMQGRFGIPGPPALLFFDRSGDELRGYRVMGFVPAEEFAEHLGQVAP